MPSLSQITNKFFVSLIDRLGVRPPPPESFLLSNVVQPVSIVDSDISIPAVLTTQILDTGITSGVRIAPVANTLLADTGPMAAGTYQVLLMLGVGNVAGGADFEIERRDAANAANIWSQLGFMNTNGPGLSFYSFVAVLQASERLRAIIRLNASATIQATFFIKLA